MWIIKHIFDGEYGCEEHDEPMVSVTIVNEQGEEQRETAADAWLTENGLDIGSEWPDYSDFSLETEDLILKKSTMHDWKDIYENLWCHEESARYMLWDVTRSESEAKARMQRTLAFQKNHKYAFLVYQKATSESAEMAIGFAGMTESAPGMYEDTGVALGPDFVKMGYGTQIVKALCGAAKAEGAHTFLGSNRSANIASRNLQLKCGFVYDHSEERVDPRNGVPYVLEFYRKTL